MRGAVLVEKAARTGMHSLAPSFTKDFRHSEAGAGPRQRWAVGLKTGQGVGNAPPTSRRRTWTPSCWLRAERG